MVKSNPRSIRPADLARALNSTPLGEVASERQLYRHRMRAGYRIGDGRHVDMVRYAAWLVDELEGLRARPPADPRTTYEAMKEQARARNAELSAAGRDIGPIPEVKNPVRKEKAAADFRYFCETYFPKTFYLAWSDDHLKAIARIEDAVLRGGLFAYAMPRGSGKTVLVETACVWALLYGHRPFVALIGSDEEHAAGMLDSIKSELEGNDLLLEDFPEAVYPVHCLEGIANRCAGQTFRGARTLITWTAKCIVMPTILDSRASGATVQVAGITGRLRGMKHKRADGSTIRPSLVVLDDPQTDESARSPSQCAQREKILAGAVLGLAGPGVKIAGFMPCTVIAPGDLADRILDRDKHPQWQAERTKLVYTFPTNTKLWDQYASVRAESLRKEHAGVEATEFYRQHQIEMDAGARVAWAARYNPDEISAVQHAMNLKLDRGDAAFFAEFQNEPLSEHGPVEELLSADQIVAKVSGYRRGLVPVSMTRLTCFIDVQEKMLFWMTCAWADDFTGHVVDYGGYPDQRREYFTLRDAKRSLAMVHKGAGLEGTIYGGLGALTKDLLGREWPRDDGAALRIERCLIDANWGQSTDTVYQFCRESEYAPLLLPSHGKYIGAASREFREWTIKPGDQVGQHWFIPSLVGKRVVRHILIDTNYWKSFVFSRLAAAMGDKGTLTLFGRRGEEHRLLADHLTAEYRVRTQGRGRTVDEWKAKPGRGDNHWLDCLVGNAAAASLCGVRLAGADFVGRRPRKKYTQEDLRRKW